MNLGRVTICTFGELNASSSQVRNVRQDVGAVTRIIRKEALGAEESVAHVARYVTSCAMGQVQSARNLLQKLNISGCTN